MSECEHEWCITLHITSVHYTFIVKLGGFLFLLFSHLWKIDLPPLDSDPGDHGPDFLVVGAVEGRSPGQQHVRDDAQRPQVALARVPPA